MLYPRDLNKCETAGSNSKDIKIGVKKRTGSKKAVKFGGSQNIQVLYFNNSFSICPHCTQAICFLNRTMFSESEGSGRLPNKCYHHNLGLPLIGGGIFRRAPSAVGDRKRPGIVCVDAHHTTSVACPMMSHCLHTSQETRVSGSQAPHSIKGGARTC